MADPRLFITTDMQMITGVNERDGDKDDVQSLVHALLYQDRLDIVGIASSTSKHQPGANDDRFIHHVIGEYAKDYSTLRERSGEFMSPDDLRDITYQGTKSLAGGNGVPGSTAASAAIIREAREAAEDGVPLYVATWGGMGDVARALHDAPDIADNIRLLTASGPAQEPEAHDYVRDEFAGEGDLWWIDARTTQRGIYADPDSRLPPISIDWAEDNARDHGALGDLFYDNNKDLRGSGDDYSGMKMGDSWTVFYLIDGVDNSNPTGWSWGGSYRQVDDKYWVDRTDQDFGWEGSDGARTTYAHRSAWTNDLKSRFDWLRDSDGDDDGDDDDDTPAPAPTPPDDNDNDNDNDDDDSDGGGGDDTLAIRVSGDDYEGAPQLRVVVDGDTVGTFTTEADRDEGEWQTFNVSGDFDDDATVEVIFLNDRYSGSSDTDRNLYVQSVSFEGRTVGSETELKRSGEKVEWRLDGTAAPNDGGDDRDEDDENDDDDNDNGGSSGSSGQDTITVRANGESYDGDPNFELRLNGEVIDATNAVTADRNEGEWQTFTYTGDFDDSGTQDHDLEIVFTNDRYGGDDKDRNLGIDRVTFNGETDDTNVWFDSNQGRVWEFDL